MCPKQDYFDSFSSFKFFSVLFSSPFSYQKWQFWCLAKTTPLGWERRGVGAAKQPKWPFEKCTLEWTFLNLLASILQHQVYVFINIKLKQDSQSNWIRRLLWCCLAKCVSLTNLNVPLKNLHNYTNDFFNMPLFSVCFLQFQKQPVIKRSSVYPVQCRW